MPSTLGIVASTFSPAKLSPALWLDAADTSTIIASGSPAKVSQWTNKGSLPSATQATAAAQPTTNASTINGLNVLDFDGNDRFGFSAASDYLFLVNGSVHLIAFVAVAGNTANPNALFSFMGSSRTGAQTGMWIAYDDRAAASRNDRLFHNVINGAVSTVVSNVTGNNAMVANTATAVTLLVDPGNATAANRSKVHFGGGSAIQNNSSTGTPPTSIANGFQIGASTSDAHLVGKIAEIVIVSGANATETNRVLLRDFLTAKWGL